jgi:hypothetical protein
MADSAEHSAAEPDNPKVLLIVVATTFTILLVLAIALGVNQFFLLTMRDEVERKEARQEDPRLHALRIDEKVKATTYGWVQKSSGTVRLPLDRAIDLTLKGWVSRPTGTVANPVQAGSPGAILLKPEDGPAKPAVPPAIPPH